MTAKKLAENKHARRVKLLSKIHIGKKQLGMQDDIYRAMLEGMTGKTSCGAMSDRELLAVLKAMEQQGFKAGHNRPKRSGARRMADGDQAKKIRALWIMLYHLGAVSDPSEEALSAFAERMTGIRALQWATSMQADKVIKALRGWLARLDYYHPKAADYAFYGSDGLAENLSLIQTQARKLGINDMKVWLFQNGFDGGIPLRIMSRDDLYQIIEMLGARIRRMAA